MADSSILWGINVIAEPLKRSFVFAATLLIYLEEM
jgi:hypothetical protein